MNIVSEVEKWAEDLWQSIREHIVPDAEAAAKAVLDDAKGQVAQLAQEAAQDAQADVQKAAQGAQTVAGDVAVGGIGVPESGTNPVAAQSAPSGTDVPNPATPNS